MIGRLVDRFGRTGFAALSSLIWALPMAAWAGSADLSPIDKTAYPWIALTIGLVMLVLWLFLLSRLGRVTVVPRQRRFDLQQMSRSEKRWTLALAAFATGLIAWLNGAATVDWQDRTYFAGRGARDISDRDARGHRHQLAPRRRRVSQPRRLVLI